MLDEFFFAKKNGPFWLSRRPLAKFRSDMLQTCLCNAISKTITPPRTPKICGLKSQFLKPTFLS